MHRSKIDMYRIFGHESGIFIRVRRNDENIITYNILDNYTGELDCSQFPCEIISISGTSQDLWYKISDLQIQSSWPDKMCSDDMIHYTEPGTTKRQYSTDTPTEN